MSELENHYLKLRRVRNSQDSEGNTRLHILAQNHTELIFYYDNFEGICSGSSEDINIRNKDGNTPIHLAILKNSRVAIDKLLDYGECDIYLKNKLNITPMDMAYERRNITPEVFERMGKEVIIRDILKMKVSSEDLDAIRKLPSLQMFPEECALEVSRLKSFKLGETNVTLFKILTSDPKVVAKYLRNESIAESCKEFRDNGCVIFNRRLLKKLRRGIDRRTIERDTYSVWRKLFSTLPDMCLDEIISYLSNDDLMNIHFAVMKEMPLDPRRFWLV